jgi:palmitoyltransferase
MEHGQAPTGLMAVARIASPQMLSAPDFPSDPCRCAPCSPYRWLISPMFLVVWGIVGANYFPYVIWVPHASVGSWLAVVIFHVLLALLLASYLMTVFTDPGTVPPEWHEAVAADDRLSTSHRYCERSGLYRPLRSHYCSVTGRVVLNMDHFCPWVRAWPPSCPSHQCPHTQSIVSACSVASFFLLILLLSPLGVHPCFSFSLPESQPF